MVEMSDLLQSYEKDFEQHVEMLQQMTSSGETSTGQPPADNLDEVFATCQKLLKQIEVEGMNHMSDDNVRKRISKHKQQWDTVRRQVRKFQQERDKQFLVASGENDMEAASGSLANQERQLLNNRRLLEEAKQSGYEMDEMANDIKYNLSKQSDQLQNSTMKNLFTMQKDLLQGGKLIKLIGDERRKNKIVIYSVFALLAAIFGFCIYSAF